MQSDSVHNHLHDPEILLSSTGLLTFRNKSLLWNLETVSKSYYLHHFKIEIILDQSHCSHLDQILPFQCVRWKLFFNFKVMCLLVCLSNTQQIRDGHKQSVLTQAALHCCLCTAESEGFILKTRSITTSKHTHTHSHTHTHTHARTHSRTPTSSPKALLCCGACLLVMRAVWCTVCSPHAWSGWMKSPPSQRQMTGRLLICQQTIGTALKRLGVMAVSGCCYKKIPC